MMKIKVNDIVRFKDFKKIRTREDFIIAFGHNAINKFKVTKIDYPVKGQCTISPSSKPTWGWLTENFEIIEENNKDEDLFE